MTLSTKRLYIGLSLFPIIHVHDLLALPSLFAFPLLSACPFQSSLFTFAMKPTWKIQHGSHRHRVIIDRFPFLSFYIFHPIPRIHRETFILCSCRNEIEFRCLSAVFRVRYTFAYASSIDIAKRRKYAHF